ncbi:MAG: STAS domain-containing protein [Solirubrobacterales bacterium]
MRTGEIVLRRDGSGIPVVAVSGEHDLNTAPDLRARLDEVIEQGGPVVIDLSPATFVDSSILGAILDARRRAQGAGIGFAVAQGDGAAAVTRVLEITGLRDELPVHDDVASAGAALGNGKPAA